MKKLTKQIIAFVLMVCMLSAIMAPVSFKVAAAAVGDVIPYNVDGSGLIAEGDTFKAIPKVDSANATPVKVGDFTWLPCGSDIGTPRAYANYVYFTGFKVEESAPNRWVALKFTVAEAGIYNLAFRFDTNTSAKIYIEKFSDQKTYNDEYAITGDTQITSSVGTVINNRAGLENVVFDASGDYVMFLKANRVTENAVKTNFYGMDLTLVEKSAKPVEQTYTFNTAGAAVGNWSKIANNGTYQCKDTHTYTANTSVGGILALQVNDIVAGTYRLDFTVSPHSDGCQQNLYILPASVLEAGRTADDIKAAVEDLDSVGIVDCSPVSAGGNASQIIPYYTFENTGDYVLVFQAAAAGRPSLKSLTVVPVEKVVNDTYYTVAEALAAGETNITLTGDITEDITLTGGAVLDLNGKTVTGDITAVNGTVTDSGATKGGVVGEVDLQSSNSAIALLDNDTYRFFEYDLVNVGEKNGKMGTDGAVYFGFGLFFEDAAAYDYVAEGGLTIGATLSWTGAKAGSAEIGGMTEAVAQWIAAENTTDDGDCLYVKVTGLEGNLEAGDTVTVTPSFTYAGGVNGSFGGSITYTVG